MTTRHAERVRGGRAYSLYAPSGARKYVNAGERARFLRTADSRDPATRALCLVLLYTGCRLSEALDLTFDSIQSGTHVVAIRSLKKRRKDVVREVPVPEVLVAAIAAIGKGRSGSDRIFPVSRTWSWTLIKRVMAQADIHGAQATPKGLRHGFGVHAIQCEVPLNLVQRWLGHAQLSTTAIYADAVGPEERRIAERMW